jgi:predicted neutral ceramidase superfamily lipid hydrolase
MELSPELITLATAIIGLISTVVAAKYGVQYQKAKSKAAKIVDLINTVYDAAKDDKVTEEEFQAIVDKVKVLVEKEEQ